MIEGRLTRRRISRTDDYTQAGERFQLSEPWEQDELIANWVGNLSQCDRAIQERMLWHLLLADDELGLRVGEGIRIGVDDVKHLKPLETQGWGPKEQARLDNLGRNGPRDVTGHQMTHCVPNTRDVLAPEQTAAE